MKTLTVKSFEKVANIVLSEIGKKWITALNADLKAGKKLQETLMEFYAVPSFTEFDENLPVIIASLKVANELSGTRKYKDVLAFLNTGAKKPLALYNMVQSEDFIGATEINQKRIGTKALKENNDSTEIGADFSDKLSEKLDPKKETEEKVIEAETVLTMSQKEMDKEGAELIARLSSMVMDGAILKHLRSAVAGTK